MITRRFDILGMSCSACSSHIEKIVEKLNGVGSVSVNLLTNSMTVEYDDLLLNADSIVSAVQHAGYVAVPRFEDSVYSPDGASFAVIRDRLGIRFFLSLLFCLPLAWLASAPFFHWPLPHDLGPSHALSSAITQLLLTLPILIVNGSYFRRGLRALARRSPDMDSLIAIGAGTAFVYGVFVVYEIMYANYVNDLYFVSAGMILTLVTLGKLLESKAKKKTTAAIRRLVSLRPETAIVLKDGAETRVRVEDIAVGDIVVIRQGQHIPVDGVVLEGKSTLDVSAITGESIPVMKAPGDRVWSATINLTGVFTFRADRVGTDTTLASIIALVEESSSSKVPIANLADRISGIFVPAVIVISSLTAIGWLVSGEPLSAAISSAISVLVISCPCALGLAAPTAVMVGTGIGARNGILVKNASALEMADAVDTVIIDKTGTLTEGKPRVTDIISTSLFDHNELLLYAASIQKMSEFPLAAAIVSEAEKSGLSLLPADSFNFFPGQGVSAAIKGITCFAGSPDFLVKNGISVSELMPHAKQFALDGKMPFCFGMAGKPLGVIAVADVIKSGSREAVAALHSMGLDVIMVTGDNQLTAEGVRRKTGIRQVFATHNPSDKADFIKKLQDEGHKVAMIGDGINGAPALAVADVGIALGAGTDIAIESADIVLVRNNLFDVVTAFRLGKAVLANVRESLFWALGYNLIGIPVAAGVFYPVFGWTLSPMIAAAVMSLSSLSVVLNALRLNFFRKTKSGGYIS